MALSAGPEWHSFPAHLRSPGSSRSRRPSADARGRERWEVGAGFTSGGEQRLAEAELAGILRF